MILSTNMPKRSRKPSPYWTFLLQAQKKGFSEGSISRVWNNLEEELRAPWRVYCKSVRSDPVLTPPDIEGETRTRLYIEERRVQAEKEPSYNWRLSSTWDELEHRYGAFEDGFYLDDVFSHYDATFGPTFNI